MFLKFKNRNVHPAKITGVTQLNAHSSFVGLKFSGGSVGIHEAIFVGRQERPLCADKNRFNDESVLYNLLVLVYLLVCICS